VQTRSEPRESGNSHKATLTRNAAAEPDGTAVGHAGVRSNGTPSMTIAALAIAGITHAPRSTWCPDRKRACHSHVRYAIADSLHSQLRSAYASMVSMVKSDDPVQAPWFGASVHGDSIGSFQLSWICHSMPSSQMAVVNLIELRLSTGTGQSHMHGWNKSLRGT
jgi:hypothetical protein